MSPTFRPVTPTTSPALAGMLELGDETIAQGFSRACRVIQRGIPILLHGETGSGKDYVANAVHQASPTMPAVVHFDRNGFGYTLNRESGELLVAEKFDPNVNWSSGVNMKTGRPTVVAKYSTDQNGEDVNSKGICPAALGSKDQQPASFDRKSKLFMAPTNHVCMDYEPFKVEYTAGQPYVGATLSMFPAPGSHGGMGNFVAWDAGTGKIAWSKPEKFSVWSGALTTAGDIVFYATLEGYMKAVSTKDGPSKLCAHDQAEPVRQPTDTSREPNVIRLDAPRHAADAGIVPIAFWIQPASPLSRDIHKIHLIIDENPQPVALVLEYAPDHEPIGMETRVRIEAYSHVRSIAEARDGGLWESVRYVKASGGCSAAPPADAAAAMGRMQLRRPDVLKTGEPVLAQLVILHPNDSGLAMNQVTRLFQPAHYLYNVNVTFDGTLVWAAEINFSLSENPNFLFRFTPRSPGTMTVAAMDTRGQRYEAQFPMRMA